MNGRDRDEGVDDPRAPRREQSELARAAKRLEDAVEDLVSSASGVVSDRAAGVVDDLERSARRLKSQMEAQRRGDAAGEAAPSPRDDVGRRRTKSPGIVDPDDWFLGAGIAFSGGEARRSNGWMRDLYREPNRGWIAGVCAGLARYFEVDVWVARLAAVSLLFLLPGLAFWAYIAAIFLLAKRPRTDVPAPVPKGARATRSSAPELGPRLSPRPGVRALRARFRDLQQRLERMETYVTLPAFDLSRQIADLEGRSGGAR